jgi:hypothetical protein
LEEPGSGVRERLRDRLLIDVDLIGGLDCESSGVVSENPSASAPPPLAAITT